MGRRVCSSHQGLLLPSSLPSTGLASGNPGIVGLSTGDYHVISAQYIPVLGINDSRTRAWVTAILSCVLAVTLVRYGRWAGLRRALYWSSRASSTGLCGGECTQMHQRQGSSNGATTRSWRLSRAPERGALCASAILPAGSLRGRLGLRLTQSGKSCNAPCLRERPRARFHSFANLDKCRSLFLTDLSTPCPCCVLKTPAPMHLSTA